MFGVKHAELSKHEVHVGTPPTSTATIAVFFGQKQRQAESAKLICATCLKFRLADG